LQGAQPLPGGAKSLAHGVHLLRRDLRLVIEHCDLALRGSDRQWSARAVRSRRARKRGEYQAGQQRGAD